jgi:hypothetical protein
LIGKSEGNRSLGRHRTRWKSNIRGDLREVGWEDVDWMYVVWDRDQRWDLLNTVIKCRVPKEAENFLNS